MLVFQVQDLRHRFGGSQDVLRGISFDVEPATMTAIMGPSGSGKSTLLNCMAQLVRPTSGEVTYRGTALARMNQKALDRLRRTSWGFIFQAYNLIDALTAVDNVKIPALFDGTKMSTETAERALHSVGLDGLGSRYPDELSGGQCQRVAIARALATRRDVVFADEPTGALDSEARREVMRNLHELPANGGTVVLVTHDPTVAAAASRVIFLYDGLIAGDETGLSSREIADRLADLEGTPC